ncbi:MAG: DUF2156 domain-containing protein [Deltaproteobacteria bacterium]|nr:DUF2156 domain-containing protein [Deltaproteobacteria bacterium]
MPFTPPRYPEFVELTRDARDFLQPALKALEPEVSELTFANLYLFRKDHGYMLSTLPDGSPVISGKDDGAAFFILPDNIPPNELLTDLFRRFGSMKCVTEKNAKELSELGLSVAEDRDNFDYLYSRQELSSLAGRRDHRKKNLVNSFTGRYNYEARPLLPEHRENALAVLEEWRAGEDGPGDYEAAKEGPRAPRRSSPGRDILRRGQASRVHARRRAQQPHVRHPLRERRPRPQGSSS